MELKYGLLERIRYWSQKWEDTGHDYCFERWMNYQLAWDTCLLLRKFYWYGN